MGVPKPVVNMSGHLLHFRIAAPFRGRLCDIAHARANDDAVDGLQCRNHGRADLTRGASHKDAFHRPALIELVMARGDPVRVADGRLQRRWRASRARPIDPPTPCLGRAHRRCRAGPAVGKPVPASGDSMGPQRVARRPLPCACTCRCGSPVLPELPTEASQ